MKNFTIKTFGILSEKLPTSEFEFPFHGNSEELLEALKDKYPELESLDFSIAIDKQIIHEQTVLEGEEEIALLPPFSGG